ncbi:MAG: hypothetical protein KQH79_01585 [Bacteroidetes bacterium]|nr:hypothetical protein [Bacteroidota bacterium]
MSNVENNYRSRAEQFSKKISAVRSRLVVLSVLRFLTFIGLFFIIILLVKQYTWFKLSLLCFILLSFIALVTHYIKQKEVLNYFHFLLEINTHELNVLNNEYSAFDSGEEYICRDHEYSYDLDLFGEGSLFQYLNRTVTLVGKNFLARQLLDANKVNRKTIENRQNVTKELVHKLDWRQDFMATALATPMGEDDNKKINDWLNQPVYFLKKLHFKILAAFLPVITLTFLSLFIAGISHYSWFILFALIQLMIASLILRRTNKEQSKVSEELKILRSYAKLLKLIEKEDFSSHNLQSLKMDLKTDQASAIVALKKLIRIIDAFDTRLNLILGVVLNATLMWDLVSVMRLEKWKIKFGNNIKRWTEVVAEFDYYISLANYTYNNQNFSFPMLSEETVLHATELGHPLIPKEVRVNNDFIIKSIGTIEIITGANMAGKSTFLRTVGVNLILAMNGMPVCAGKFEFKLQKVYSGMRTADSLKENESYFYAELKRLKFIVEKLREGQQIFILLDEILKGTNSVDKAKGSWKFVENLLALKATGIIATHDLSLCALEKEYPENIENKCFEVQIDGDKIDFDYKLRPGITQNMNASLLMQQMGIFTK